jgi:hypothetical protein
MTTQLLFTSADGSTVYATDGTTVTRLADGSAAPAFADDPIYGYVSTTSVGSAAYLTMADTTGATSAIWRYNGTTLTQITASADYVYNMTDASNAVAPDPLVSFNGDLIFSQASLASNLADNTNPDTATLAVYNPALGTITQPVAPHGGYDPQDFATIGSTLYFEATDSVTAAPAIYSFNGTAVTEVYNLHPANANEAPAAGAVSGPMVAFNNHIYFGSGDQSLEELTATTSLSNSATNVAASVTVVNGFGTASGLIVAGTHLFFDSGNSGVYSLSTTNTLTQVVANAQYYFPEAYNGAAYFMAGASPDLYSSTGGTPSVVSTNFNARDFAVMGSTLYFQDSTDLGTYNGTTFSSLAVPGGAGSVPLTVVPVAATAWSDAANPIAVVAGASVTYHNGGAAVALDPGLTLTDSSSATMTSAAIVIGDDGLVAGDTLNFTNQNGITASFNSSSGEMTLAGTASVADYQAALDSITYSFTPGSGDATNGGDNDSRTIIWAVGDGIDNSIAATSSMGLLCFCAGTLIATPGGNVPVEHLRAGDMVTTAHNGPREVKWIGIGNVLATRGKRGAATPVIVRKGALSDNVPAQDLRVTKGHSLFVDGVLIPVEYLINHQSIRWDDHAQAVSLWHIELDTHDVLLANGAPAESYRDDGNRWLFQNANSGWDSPPREPYAPVLTGGAIVDAIWRRLLQRSGPRALPPLTEDPDLHLLVDGRRIDAVTREKFLYIFRLPDGCARVRIASRDCVPEQLGLVRDSRSLGVALRRIEITHGRRMTLIDACDGRLTDGFHDYEPGDDLRWTNGDALIPEAAFAHVTGTAMVGLHVAGSTHYPLFVEVAERAAV